MALQLQPSTAEPTRRDDDSTGDYDFQEPTFFSRGYCCCFSNLQCCSQRKSDNWERISASENEDGRRSLWLVGIRKLKKVKEWSELAAGPKWKTFIRRFNKTAAARQKSAKFQYDPLSYALNFDDGPGQNGQFEDDGILRNFSSRYAAAAMVIQVGNGQLKEVSTST